MKVLLTGSTGFLGRHVLAQLLQAGHSVVVLNRSVDDPSFIELGVQVVLGELASGSGFAEIPWAELDAVIHLAASGVKASHRVWADTLGANIIGTQRLLNMIQLKATKHPVVFVARTFYERVATENPALLDNPYTGSKWASSELTRLWAAGYCGATILGTFFQVYGPGDGPGNVLSYAARQLKAGQPAVFGSGGGLRDWIYVSDASSAVIAATFGDACDGLTEVDIGTGELISIRSAIEKLAKLAGPGIPALVFDPTKDRADGGIALFAEKKPRGWSHSTTLENGLKQLYLQS